MQICVIGVIPLSSAQHAIITVAYLRNVLAGIDTEGELCRRNKLWAT